MRRFTLGTAVVVALHAAAPPTHAQDSVIVLRSGRPATPAAPWRYDRPLGDLPDWLSPDDCGRLVRFRDGELFRTARGAVSRAEINAEAAADLTALRADLSRTFTITDLLGARAAVVLSIREMVEVVRDAFQLAKFLSTPTGAPKTLAEIVVAVAREGGKAGADAIVEGKVDDYRRRLTQASQDLEGTLRQLILESERISRFTDLARATNEMHELAATKLPEIERRIEAYRVAARAANRDLEGVNAELSAIDATLRRACR
jgi:hypothetical protein